EEAASVREQHRVWRVEVRAVIEQTACARLEPAALRIEIPDKTLHLAIRRDEQHPLIAQFEKVGAFGGSNLAVRMLKEHAAIGPFEQSRVFGFVNVQDGLAAFGLI